MSALSELTEIFSCVWQRERTHTCTVRPELVVLGDGLGTGVVVD